MKTAIVYYSRHSGDTKKLPDAITKGHPTQDRGALLSIAVNA